MGAQVTGVQQPLPAGLHQESVGVIGRVVDEDRRDRERTEGELLPFGEGDRIGGDVAVRNEGGGCPQDAKGRFAHRHRQAWAGEVGQPDVVAVAMAENEREEIAAAGQSVDRRVAIRVVGVAVQGEAEVEQQARAGVLQLDTGATDLARAAVNTHPHRDPACPVPFPAVGRA